MKPKSRTVEAVTPTPGHNVHDRAPSAPVFGRELVRNQPYFLYDVGIVNRLRAAGNPRFVDVLAVDHEIVRAEPHAVGREVDAIRELALTARHLAHARRRQSDIENVAKTAGTCRWRPQRKFGNAPCVKMHADFGIADVQHRRIFLNGDFLSDTGRLQHDVQHRFLVQDQNDAQTDIPRKSAQLNRHFVGTNRQIRNAETANLICKYGAADIRFNVSRCDHRSGNDCLLRIHNRTRDCSRRGLSEQTNRKYREGQ